ncbi:MAG TPA: hypothetical protein VGP32_03605 [Steroidobacteraceae bacterium]|jgi:DNA-binding ferritin-like protein|nr:hypothetical protein [Steroidobacteraceae bacterium]
MPPNTQEAVMFDTRNDLTADLFTGISRQTDKDLWFLEAHLHAKR